MGKEGQRRIITAGICIVLFYWIIEHFNIVWNAVNVILAIISPFILGAAIAFILNVPMKQVEKYLFAKTKSGFLRKIRRPLAWFLTIVILAAIIVLALFVIIPELTKTFSALFVQIPQAFDSILASAERTFALYPQVTDYLSNIQIDWDGLIKNISQWVSTGTKGAIDSGISVISNVISAVMSFFIGFIFSIYILFQKETLGRQGKKVLYALCKDTAADKILEILTLTNKTFSNFLTGQCLEACILGTLFFVTMSILRLPYALLMGIVIAITALIPMVGAFMGCAVGIFLIVLVNPIQALIFIIMFLVLQQLEGNLIYPHVVGNSVGLPGIWVLVAVTVGGNLFGVIGMLTFIPMFSVCYVLFREFINNRLMQKNKRDDTDEEDKASKE